jgi:hypothetical protein
VARNRIPEGFSSEIINVKLLILRNNKKQHQYILVN